MSRAEWLTMQDDVLRELEQLEPITIHVNNGASFDAYQAQAFITGYQERDLLPGGSIQQGDIKLIISATNYPAAITRPLERKDRIEVNGRPCSIIHFNPNSRTVNGQPIAYEIAVR